MDELARLKRLAKKRKTGSGHHASSGGGSGHYGGVDDPLTHEPARAKAPTHHQAPKQPATHTTHHPAHKAPHKGTHAAPHVHEPALSRDHATIVSFNSSSYTATITLARSPDVAIAGVPVSRVISSSTIAAGQVAAVLFFDRHNNNDAMIVGIY